MTDKIPEGWRECKLGDYAQVNMGQSPKSKFYNNLGNGIPFLQGNRTFGKRFPTISTYCTNPKKIANKGDILFSVRAPVGEINIANQQICIGRGLSSLSSKSGDNIFLFYLLHFIKDKVLISESGTVFGSINKSDLENVDVLLPPLSEQRAIASVLGSLDDKIDLLHNENHTLEQLAETIFRQWFIEEVDDSWEEVPLGNSNLATIISSGINYFEGEKTYLATGDVDNTEVKGETSITFENRPSRANMEPVVNSVWFAKKGGVRKLLMFTDYSQNLHNLILSTGFTGLKTTALSHYYVWCYIMSTEFQEIRDSFVSGTVQPDINNDSLNQIMIPKPDDTTLLRFNEIVKPFFIKISFNQVQIRTLENLRDTLLPKLMSGEVRVEI